MTPKRHQVELKSRTAASILPRGDLLSLCTRFLSHEI